MSLSVVSEGQILAGKYRVERVIGEGGMGVVVAARHLQLDEPVAIKFLLPDVAQSAEAIERFAREGRASIKIKSEHVVRVMDVGTLENGLPYMVMEFLRGGDLSALVAGRGGIGIAEAVEYVLQASEAIADAHALGIVHRDLKPANLFLTLRTDGTPCVKVLDFGISKHTGSTSSGLAMTKTTAVMGSPLYMSPEQMSSSRDVDARSDIWALGAILYELLSGRPPFEGETLPQVCSAIIINQPDPLRSRRADIPEGLDLVVARCLEKKREHRFQNMAEFAIALSPFGPPRSAHSADRILRVLSSAGLASPAASIAAMPTHSAAAQTAAQTAGAWAKAPPNPNSSNKTAIIGTVVGLLAVTALASVFALRALRHTPKPSADPAIVSAPVTVPVSPVQRLEPAIVASAPVAAESASAPAASVPTTSPVTASIAGKAKLASPAGSGAKKAAVRGKGLDAFSDSK